MLRITLPLLLLISFNVFAHQPKLINYSPLKDNLHMVTSPEISKAYYSKLTGTPHYYQINSDKKFFGANTWEQILTWAPILLYIGPYMDVVHWQKFDVRAYIPHIALLVLIFILYFIINKTFFRKRKYFA